MGRLPRREELPVLDEELEERLRVAPLELAQVDRA
jgi:hypothetical protein